MTATPAPGTSPRSTPPPPGLTAGEWRNHAACYEHPRLKATAWDDTVGRETADTRAKRTSAARAVCWNECPVRQACLDSVDLNYDEGIRGGQDLREVRERRRRAAAHRGAA